MTERNWMRRDVLIKQALGFDDAYWHRAGDAAAAASGVTPAV